MSALHTWEIIVGASSNKDAPPAVRRLQVPGGWLYQVEHYELVNGSTQLGRIWHPPVFVTNKAP